MRLHIGFSGTRYGMTEAQSDAVVDLLDETLRLHGFIAHHGDCVGADAQFHRICRAPRGGPVAIEVHPGLPKWRAWCQGDMAHRPALYRERNRAIVDACSVIIAAPYENEPQPRGGTWATIRMALKAKHRPTLYVVGREGQLLDVEEMR